MQIKLLVLTVLCSVSVLHTVADSPDKCKERSLQVFAHYGYNLSKEDNLPGGHSDPYLQVTAYDCHGNPTQMNGVVVIDNASPVWAQELNFGEGTWQSFSVEALDHDNFNEDDPLTEKQVFSLQGYSGGTTYTKICTTVNCDGFVLFDYTSY